MGICDTSFTKVVEHRIGDLANVYCFISPKLSFRVFCCKNSRKQKTEYSDTCALS